MCNYSIRRSDTTVAGWQQYYISLLIVLAGLVCRHDGGQKVRAESGELSAIRYDEETADREVGFIARKTENGSNHGRTYTFGSPSVREYSRPVENT